MPGAVEVLQRALTFTGPPRRNGLVRLHAALRKLPDTSPHTILTTHTALAVLLTCFSVESLIRRLRVTVGGSQTRR